LAEEEKQWSKAGYSEENIEWMREDFTRQMGWLDDIR